MHYLQCKVHKLHYCVPGKSLKDGLKFFSGDNGVKDIIYHYLYGEEAKVYVEYYSDSEDDEDEESAEIGEVGECTQAGDERQQPRLETLASHIERVEQMGRCPQVSSEDIPDEELTELNWKFA